jgi:TRAP-type C4-dicarboxylate transport system permease small subunit
MTANTDTVRDPIAIRVIDRINRILVSVAAAVTIVLMLHMVVDVAGRYLANRPIAGTLEYVTFWWMPLIVFLALGWAQYRSEHINVTLLTETLPDRARRVAETIADGISIVVVIILAVFAFQGAEHSFAISEAALGTATVLIWPTKFVVVLGLAGLLLQLGATVYRRFTTGIPDAAESESGLPNGGIE